MGEVPLYKSVNLDPGLTKLFGEPIKTDRARFPAVARALTSSPPSLQLVGRKVSLSSYRAHHLGLHVQGNLARNKQRPPRTMQ